MSRPVILVADNDVDFLATRIEALERAGFTVKAAPGMDEARQLLEQGGIDLAILDLRLINDADERDYSGLELARQVAVHTPKIILTRYPSWEVVRKALEPQLNGLPIAVDFIAKQESLQTLVTAVHRGLKRRGKAMPANQVQILRVVVASPGDVQPERDSLDAVIDELNRGVAADRGLRLELIRWETDTFPGFHVDGPQILIDSLLRIDQSDVLIGIFWKRFGTPTADAGSGTEHEFRLAYEAWKRGGRPQIMMYFKQQSYTPTTKTETDQWGQVLEFKRNFPKEGLWWAYRSKPQFVELVRQHLTLFLRQYKPISA